MSSQSSGCSIIIRPRSSIASSALGVVERVGVVGVGHQRRIRERRTHGAHECDVRARLDLDLDLAIALGEGGAGLRAPAPPATPWMPSEMPTAISLARAADQAGERDLQPLGLESPHAHFDRRLGHVVPAEVPLQHCMHLARCARMACRARAAPPTSRWPSTPCRSSRSV